jgi:hypothetical protein
MTYGEHLRFECEGIRKAIKWCEDQGHHVKGFLPEYVCDERKVNKWRENPEDAKVSWIPDDVDYLNDLVEKGTLVMTLGGHYDDAYAIAYARHAQKRGK